MSNKVNAREAARKEAERIAKQSAKDNRTRNILIAVIAVVVIAIAGVAFALVKESQKTALSEFEGETPAVADLRGGIPFGGSDAAAGETNGDSPTVDVYADFHCPACASFDQVNAEELRTLITSGDATVVYHPVNILDNSGNGTGYSTVAANAFIEVAEGQPDLALEFMETLFAMQPDGPGYDVAEIASIAQEVGVSDDVTAKFEDARFTEWIEAARQQAGRDGMTATPTIAFDGTIEEFDWTVPGAISERIGVGSISE